MTQRIAYLTVDDSPSARWRAKLEYLIARRITAVWFCEGRALEANPDFAIEAIHAGQILGNHGYDHPTFSELSPTECCHQISRTDEVIERLYAAAGRPRPAKFFRFPFGDKGGLRYDEVYLPYSPDGARRKEALQAFLRRIGYWQPPFEGVTYRRYCEAGLLRDVDWYWTFDCGEHAMTDPDGPDQEEGLRRVLAGIDEHFGTPNDGSGVLCSEEIILIHDHLETTEAFPIILDRLLEWRLSFRSPPARSSNAQGV